MDFQGALAFLLALGSLESKPSHTIKLFNLGACEELAGGPPPKNRIALSPERRAQEAASSSQGTQQQQQQQQAAGTAAEGGSGSQVDAAAGSSMAMPTLVDPMGPSSSDPVLPHPADPADLHEQVPMLVRPSFVCPAGLESSMLQTEKPTHCRSLPPARRSPGPRSRVTENGLQMAQMIEMMKAMTHQLQEVKAQVGKLQQDRDPFPFRQMIPYDDEDED